MRYAFKMVSVSTTRETPEDLRERGMDIGIDLLREGGLPAVKARVVAVRLGVSVGTIYNLFGQMDEFIYHLNARALDGLQDAAEQALISAKDAPPTEQMIALARAYVEYVSAHMDQWAAVVSFGQRGDINAPDWYRQKERALNGLVQSVVSRLPGMADREHVVLVARALWGAVHGIVTVSMRRGASQQTADVKRQVEFMVRCVAHGLESPYEDLPPPEPSL